MNIGHPQHFFKCAAGNSCYFDCLTKIASVLNGTERTAGSMGEAIDRAVGSGCVSYDQSDDSAPDNFTVTDPARLLFLLTGKRFTVTKEPGTYEARPGELEVDFWALSEQDGTRGKGHFCLPDYDPLVDSATRRNGFIYSKRIFRRA